MPYGKARRALCTIGTMKPLVILFIALMCHRLCADNTFVYAVQISATVQASPPRIRLQWEPDPYGARSYTVFRKGRNAAAWGPGRVLPGTATSYTDAAVVLGGAYEYQIAKAGHGYIGFGYIFAGI